MKNETLKKLNTAVVNKIHGALETILKLDDEHEFLTCGELLYLSSLEKDLSVYNS